MPGASHQLMRHAIAERSSAERRVVEAIRSARQSGMPWNAIGGFVGTTGEAARQRYTSLSDLNRPTLAGPNSWFRDDTGDGALCAGRQWLLRAVSGAAAASSSSADSPCLVDSGCRGCRHELSLATRTYFSLILLSSTSRRMREKHVHSGKAGPISPRGSTGPPGPRPERSRRRSPRATPHFRGDKLGRPCADKGR